MKTLLELAARFDVKMVTDQAEDWLRAAGDVTPTIKFALADKFKLPLLFVGRLLHE